MHEINPEEPVQPGDDHQQPSPFDDTPVGRGHEVYDEHGFDHSDAALLAEMGIDWQPEGSTPDAAGALPGYFFLPVDPRETAEHQQIADQLAAAEREWHIESCREAVGAAIEYVITHDTLLDVAGITDSGIQDHQQDTPDDYPTPLSMSEDIMRRPNIAPAHDAEALREGILHVLRLVVGEDNMTDAHRGFADGRMTHSQCTAEALIAAGAAPETIRHGLVLGYSPLPEGIDPPADEGPYDRLKVGIFTTSVGAELTKLGLASTLVASGEPSLADLLTLQAMGYADVDDVVGRIKAYNAATDQPLYLAHQFRDE